MKRILLLVIAIVWIGFFAAVAFAGDGSIPVSSILDIVRPYVDEVLRVLVAAVAGWIALRVRAWTGMEMEARHREALQSALENGARLVVDRVGYSVEHRELSAGGYALNVGIDYVLRSVPDAVAHFGLSPERVGELLRPKLVPQHDFLALEAASAPAPAA